MSVSARLASSWGSAWPPVPKPRARTMVLTSRRAPTPSRDVRRRPGDAPAQDPAVPAVQRRADQRQHGTHDGPRGLRQPGRRSRRNRRAGARPRLRGAGQYLFHGRLSSRITGSPDRGRPRHGHDELQPYPAGRRPAAGSGRAYDRGDTDRDQRRQLAHPAVAVHPGRDRRIGLPGRAARPVGRAHRSGRDADVQSHRGTSSSTTRKARRAILRTRSRCWLPTGR